jgi:hypothetical protein
MGVNQGAEHAPDLDRAQVATCYRATQEHGPRRTREAHAGGARGRRTRYGGPNPARDKQQRVVRCDPQHIGVEQPNDFSPVAKSC